VGPGQDTGSDWSLGPGGLGLGAGPLSALAGTWGWELGAGVLLPGMGTWYCGGCTGARDLVLEARYLGLGALAPGAWCGLGRDMGALGAA